MLSVCTPTSPSSFQLQQLNGNLHKGFLVVLLQQHAHSYGFVWVTFLFFSMQVSVCYFFYLLASSSSKTVLTPFFIGLFQHFVTFYCNCKVFFFFFFLTASCSNNIAPTTYSKNNQNSHTPSKEILDIVNNLNRKSITSLQEKLSQNWMRPKFPMDLREKQNQLMKPKPTSQKTPKKI